MTAQEHLPRRAQNQAHRWGQRSGFSVKSKGGKVKGQGPPSQLGLSHIHQGPSVHAQLAHCALLPSCSQTGQMGQV